MTPTQRKAMEQALEALCLHQAAHPVAYRQAISCLRSALAEQPAEQEPEGSVCGRCGGLVFDPVLPQPAKRVPLTQQEVVDGFCKTPHHVQYVCVFDAGVRFAERAHGITGEQAGLLHTSHSRRKKFVTENPDAVP